MKNVAFHGSNVPDKLHHNAIDIITAKKIRTGSVSNERKNFDTETENKLQKLPIIQYKGNYKQQMSNLFDRKSELFSKNYKCRLSFLLNLIHFQPTFEQSLEYSSLRFCSSKNCEAEKCNLKVRNLSLSTNDLTNANQLFLGFLFLLPNFRPTLKCDNFIELNNNANYINKNVTLNLPFSIKD